MKKSNKATLKLDNFDNRLYEMGITRKHLEYEIQFGDRNQLSNRLRLILIKAKAGKELTLEFSEKSFLLNRAKKIRTWENTSIENIVKDIGLEYGFSTEYADSFQGLDVNIAEDIEDTFPQRHTDAQFLRQLAKKTRCKFWIDYSGFHFVDRKELKGRRYDFIKGGNDARLQLLEFQSGKLNLTKGMKTYKLAIPQDIGETIYNEKQYTYGAYNIQGETEEEDTLYTSEVEENAGLNIQEDDYIQTASENIELKYLITGHSGIIAGDKIGLWNIGDYLSGLYKLKNIKHNIDGAYTCVITIIKQAPKKIKKNKSKKKKKDGFKPSFKDQTPTLPPDYAYKTGEPNIQAKEKTSKTEYRYIYNPETGKTEKRLIIK